MKLKNINKDFPECQTYTPLPAFKVLQTDKHYLKVMWPFLACILIAFPLMKMESIPIISMMLNCFGAMWGLYAYRCLRRDDCESFLKEEWKRWENQCVEEGWNLLVLKHTLSENYPDYQKAKTPFEHMYYCVHFYNRYSLSFGSPYVLNSIYWGALISIGLVLLNAWVVNFQFK
jgi:hypothetical protein